MFSGSPAKKIKSSSSSSSKRKFLAGKELIVASEEHDSEEKYHANRILRDYEEDLAEFEDYCQELWSWFENGLPSWAPFF